MSSQVVELLQAYEASSYNLMESHRCILQQEISQLHNRNVELNRLGDTQDSIQFLQVRATLLEIFYALNDNFDSLAKCGTDTALAFSFTFL